MTKMPTSRERFPGLCFMFCPEAKHPQAFARVSGGVVSEAIFRMEGRKAMNNH